MLKSSKKGEENMEEIKLNFEQSMARLEEIVKQLEGGKIALTDSLAFFEEGIKLAKYCETELKNIENKAAKILEGASLKDFSEE